MKEIISPELQAYHEKRLSIFRENNPKQKEGGLVFTGDSIIEFYPLKKYLGRDLPLINRGIAGTNTEWLLAHLKEQVFDLYPEKLFILIGTNDLGMGINPSEIYQRMVDIISQVKAESIGTEIHIISVLPVNQSDKFAPRVKLRNNGEIKDLNQRLSALSGISFVDLYDLLIDEDDNLKEVYTTDGLHLTQLAYEIISERISLYL